MYIKNSISALASMLYELNSKGKLVTETSPVPCLKQPFPITCWATLAEYGVIVFVEVKS